MAKDIKLVIFDLDGTVVDLKVDWNGLKKELKERLNEKYGINPDFTRMDEGLEFAAPKVGKTEMKKLYRIVERYEVADIGRARSIKRTVMLIKKLRAGGMRIVVFSSNTRKAVRKAIESAGLGGHFKFIVAKEDVERHKPEIEGLKNILKKFKLHKDEVIFIGNSWRDEEAGRRARIKTLLVQTPEYMRYCKEQLKGK